MDAGASSLSSYSCYAAFFLTETLTKLPADVTRMIETLVLVFQDVYTRREDIAFVSLHVHPVRYVHQSEQE